MLVFGENIVVLRRKTQVTPEQRQPRRPRGRPARLRPTRLTRLQAGRGRRGDAVQQRERPVSQPGMKWILDFTSEFNSYFSNYLSTLAISILENKMNLVIKILLNTVLFTYRLWLKRT